MAIAIIGDSYVRRFESYARAHQLADLRLSGQRVVYFGFGGAAIRGRKPILPSLLRALRTPDLHTVYLHVGSNDLDDPLAEPERVAQDLVSLAKYVLFTSDDVRVIVGQIHQRLITRDSGYAQRVKRANSVVRELMTDLQHDFAGRCLHAFLRGICQPSAGIYAGDGIHFNDLGNLKFFRGIRGAILRTRPFLAIAFRGVAPQFK